eukprot:CAMPEP_0202760876 /NCGR_PEP_ID=MMETSP1388-20130828/18663_1 /ASSEMBLY_ACC=CAM_ASM_000864 /TAXON_ID=37098 /ORGANISM="Isochrysis sp, Strain CCMP1244" /LENGTH=68 /DNA_ID=CAMNT_0049428941 /DNA_START=191 /DNA_END=397 /DNA_ORIENTATION=-
MPYSLTSAASCTKCAKISTLAASSSAPPPNASSAAWTTGPPAQPLTLSPAPTRTDEVETAPQLAAPVA